MKKIFRLTIILILIFGWIFDYPPVDENFWRARALAEEAATSSPASTDAIVQGQTPTSTDEITVQEQADQENAPEEEFAPEEEVAPEEVAPPEESALLPQPPLKERTLHKYFEVAQNAGHRCGAETFSIDISGRASAQARILLGGKKVQSGEVEIGSLPLGIDILFLKNRSYLSGASQNDSSFDIEIVNQEGSQKGSFNVPILYTDRENNQITVCQINIVNF